MKEIVICSAIKMHDDYVVRGHRHMDCIITARKIPRYSKLGKGPHWENQGFVTSFNRYVDRKEGLRLQLKAGIESHAKIYGDDYGYQLFSEDLY